MKSARVRLTYTLPLRCGCTCAHTRPVAVAQQWLVVRQQELDVSTGEQLQLCCAARVATGEGSTGAWLAADALHVWYVLGFQGAEGPLQ